MTWARCKDFPVILRSESFKSRGDVYRWRPCKSIIRRPGIISISIVPLVHQMERAVTPYDWRWIVARFPSGALCDDLKRTPGLTTIFISFHDEIPFRPIAST